MPTRARLRGDATAGGIHALCELLRERLASSQEAGNNRLPDEFTCFRSSEVLRAPLTASYCVARVRSRG
jgi:hypothetical protein